MKLKTYSRKNPLTVTVRRKRWLRGGRTVSALLDVDSNKMCCLGFAARAIGVPRKLITDVLTPAGVNDFLKGLNCVVGSGQIMGNTKTANALMEKNDDGTIGNDVREKKIASLGKRIGLKFKFVN